MTESNLAEWLLEGGLPRIAENLARVMRLALGPEGVRAAGDALPVDSPCGECGHSMAEHTPSELGVLCFHCECGGYARQSDTPCSCDESVRLRAEVAGLSHSVADMVLQRDELRAEVERLKAELLRERTDGDTWRVEAERAQLSELGLKAERERTRQALLSYHEHFDFEHMPYASGDDEVDCPQDDTCECCYMADINEAMAEK